MTHTAPPVLLSAHRLSKSYTMEAGVVAALSDVDLELRAGQLTVLLGASGSGKSTLLNLLGGLDVPSSGEVRYLGVPLPVRVSDELTEYRRRHVGFVFQFYHLIPGLTARENVALVAEIADAPLTPEQALARVGLSDRLDHFPSQLSGGEQQRVAIARAIVKRPRVLLCDEPTGALDVATGRLVLQVLEEVSRDPATTTAIITHNVAIGSLADQVLHLSSGRIVGREQHESRVPVASIVW